MLAQSVDPYLDPIANVHFIHSTPSIRRISSMELFLFEYKSCMLKITSGGVNGWGECVLPESSSPINLVRWGGVFVDLKGLCLSECLLHIRDKEISWGAERCQLAQSALFHLAWQIQNPEYSTIQETDRSPLSRHYLIEQSQSYYSF
jgi:hypothetical protein